MSKKASALVTALMAMITLVSLLVISYGSLDERVDFSGLVVDENDKPISGAIVDVSIRSWGFSLIALFRGARFKHFKATTDENGVFSIRRNSGDSLTIKAIIKPGYDLVDGQDLNFSSRSPGKSLQKKDARFILASHAVSSPRGLKEFEFRTRIHCNGGFVGFDLRQDSKSTRPPSGDIRVYFNRNPARLNESDKTYDWKLRVEIPNGGLTEPHPTKNGLGFRQSLGPMFKAPEQGYTSIYELAMNRTNAQWRESKTFMFFFKTGSNYGKAVLQIDAWAREETTQLSLRGTLNTTGSTLLGTGD